MKQSQMSIEEIRQYCIDNGLNFFDYITKQQDTSAIEKKERKSVKVKKKKSPKKAKDIEEPIKPKKDVRSVVIDTLDEFRASYPNNEPVSLDEFSLYVESDIEREGLEIGVNCPLLGFVANTLYGYASEVKFGKSPNSRARINEQVRLNELRKLIGINFGEDGFKRIAGFLTPEEVSKSYPLSEDGRFRNERGDYNVEGVRCWVGEGKEGVRSTLVDLVRERIIKRKVGPLSDKKKRLQAEKVVLKKEIEDIKIQESESVTPLVFTADDPAPVHTIRRRFIKPYLGTESNRSGINYKRGQGNSIVFSFENQGSKDRFVEMWERFIKTRSGEFCNAINLEEVKKRSPKKQNNLERRINDIDLELIDLANGVNGLSINYLGLEGPNFASYLEIFSAVTREGLSIDAVIPEYSHRIANIMRSVVNSGVNPRLSDVKIVPRNIDELILLDFVEDEDLKVDYSNAILSVIHPSGNMGLDEYHGLLDELDLGGATLSHLSSKYSVPESLIKKISERPKTKFDVVFLDYVGTTSKKRERALEVLLARRLNDKAVVAITTNLNPSINPKIPLHQLPEYTFSQMLDFSHDAEYVVEDVEGGEYKDKVSNMNFFAYVVERNEQK